MDKIKVGIVGYGTIGSRVAAAVLKQPDMALVGITAFSHNYRIAEAAKRSIPIYSFVDNAQFPVPIKGTLKDLCKASDIIVDCSPKKCGAENKEKYYAPWGVKTIFQGGEKAKVTQCSFNAQCNFDEAKEKQFVRVVSCNTTGLARTIMSLMPLGIESVRTVLIRRAADPNDSCKGPINAIKPEMKDIPSHHGPDVKTVIPSLEIFSMAVAVPTTLMHLHSLDITFIAEPALADVIALLEKNPRLVLIDDDMQIPTTAELMDWARIRGNSDLMQIAIWRKGIGVSGREAYLFQAVHQESDVVPENIDCIRAMLGTMGKEQSMAVTDKTLGLK
ncbi:MAG: type II glyceraldehyde-3-phosphate dehydrogenase [Nanoarchaeota archaeon]